MIYIVFGHPRAGKTYFCTRIALEVLQRNKKVSEEKRLKVFSNYPIFDERLGSSLVWKDEYASEAITDAVIIIDEAYRSYSSRNSTRGTFTVDMHTMFATNGHNNCDFWLIVHDPARLDTVIREMTNTFWYLKKYQLPLMDRPFAFKAESYLDQEALSKRYTTPNACYGIDRYWFRKRIARAYDTHYFRKQEEPELIFESWSNGNVLDKKPKTSIFDCFKSLFKIKSKDNGLGVIDDGSCFNSLNLPKKKKFNKFGFVLFEFLMLFIATCIYSVIV